MVEFADFNHGPMETPMTETTLPLLALTGLPRRCSAFRSRGGATVAVEAAGHAGHPFRSPASHPA